MTVTAETLKALAAPFPAGLMQFRAGKVTRDGSKAMALAFIDARTVQDRLDTTVGPENWQCRFHWEEVGGTVMCVCSISIWFGDQWIVKQDGAGTTNYEAIKGGMSDALKRCAVQWGIGRSLYFLPTVWVPCRKVGKAVVLTEVPSIPAWYHEGRLYDNSMAVATVEPAPIQQEPVIDPAPALSPDPVAVVAQAVAPAVAAPAVAPQTLPASFPTTINPAAAVGFGKKVMSNGRSIREYTWGEIATMESGEEARNYVEWMAKASAEKRQQGKDPMAAMKLAEQMVTWWLSSEAEAATASIVANTTVNDPFDSLEADDTPF